MGELHRIDLSKFNIRTDLVIDDEVQESDIKRKEINDHIKVTTIEVSEELGKTLNRKSGTYITIEFLDITNHEDFQKVNQCLTEELKQFLKKKGIQERDACFILGLGNRFSTADSLGPAVVEQVMVTRHLFELGTDVKDGIRNVAAISPGVMANTGIETYDIITSLVSKIKPKFLIVVDSLASSSIDRINRTIQITDTGIHPGSGIGNHRKEISMETIGVPVIAIGVPTVVESSIIVNDTIDYIFKHLSYIKEHYEVNKLVVGHQKGYANEIKSRDLSLDEKKEVSGILGTLDEETKRELIYEVLSSIDYNLIVTPKEIDFLIERLSEAIATSLNHCLHLAVTD